MADLTQLVPMLTILAGFYMRLSECASSLPYIEHKRNQMGFFLQFMDFKIHVINTLHCRSTQMILPFSWLLWLLLVQ